MNAAGEPLKHIDFAELEAIARRLEAEGVESLAILFLHSYRNPSHEIAAKRFFQRRLPQLFVSASHELSQEYREFERTSTVAANAYIGRQVERYLGEVESYLEEARFPGRFLIVQSSGGLFRSAQARSECIRMLESGPAAGVIGTQALCASLGIDHAIAFDMGGTTAKAGMVLHGRPLMANNVMVGGYAEGLPIQVPMIDIQEVGTGGGSIARIGAGNALRVGPQSAGANPGPVCYGRGGREPTVTDANLLLGRLSAERFLGGDMRLDLAKTRDAMAALRVRVGLIGRSGGRRHRAHRGGLDGERGEARHHRARPRRARLPDGVLRRRGAAARRARGARAADPRGDRAQRPRPLLRLRHAGRGPAARFRAHRLHAARRRAVRHVLIGVGRRRSGGTGGHERFGRSRSSTAPTCATSARSTR